MVGGHPTRALLVEGNGAWAPLVNDILVEQGIRATHVLKFEEAIPRLCERFGLIFTEVAIGRERCFPFLSEIRTRRGNASIVAISGAAPLRDIFLLRDYGVQHFIEYPVSRNKLECVLRSCDPNGEPSESLTESGLIGNLSPMEHATLDCVLRGMTYSEIAAYRGVSANTVKSQVRSILTKMGVSNQKELIRRMLPVGANH